MRITVIIDTNGQYTNTPKAMRVLPTANVYSCFFCWQWQSHKQFIYSSHKVREGSEGDSPHIYTQTRARTHTHIFISHIKEKNYIRMYVHVAYCKARHIIQHLIRLRKLHIHVALLMDWTALLRIFLLKVKRRAWENVCSKWVKNFIPILTIPKAHANTH